MLKYLKQFFVCFNCSSLCYENTPKVELDYLTQSTVQSAKKSGGLAGLIKRWKSEIRWRIPTTWYSKNLDLIENAQVSRSRCVETTHHHQCHFHSSGGNHFFLIITKEIFFTTDHHHADSNWIPCNERLHSAIPRGSGLNIMIIASQWQRFWFGNHLANKIIPISLKYQASGSRLNPYDGALFSRIAVTLGQVSIYWWRQYNLSSFPKLSTLCSIRRC